MKADLGVEMYTLLHSMPFRQLLSQQLPVLGSSLLIAEVFYKFHSFLLETGAFLATWFVIDWVFKVALFHLRKWRGATPHKIAG